MAKPSVIVTGGAGFLGSHTVVELHAAGYNPVIVDDFSNSNVAALDGINTIIGEEVLVHRVDCTDEEALLHVFQSTENIVGVIHFAAFKAVGESVKEPLKYFRNNLGSTVSLLSVMERCKVGKLVFSSSCTVYGEPDDLPVTEQSQIKPPLSPYSRTKQMCEGIITDAAACQPLLATSLRYFNPIGAHPSGLIGELPLGVPNNLVPYITQTGIGLREQLTVFGNDYQTSDGTAVRDFIHVVDLAKAHLKALEWLNGSDEPSGHHFFNLGTGNGASVLEAIKAFEEVSGQSLPWKFGPRRTGDIEKIWADTTKANEVLGWKAETGIVDAMRDAWHWEQCLKKRKP